MQTNDLTLFSSAFPAGTLLDSYYDRDVTRLSDRGLASNAIGDRWSDLCADVLSAWPGSVVPLPDGRHLQVEHVYRLDAIPSIARIASRHGLQNPDFIVVGDLDGHSATVSMDAKFSIDTAKASQVSADSLAALIDLGERITDLLSDYPDGHPSEDGYFLSPDSPLTAYVLQLRRGRLAASVSPQSVIRLPTSPVSFLKPLQGFRLIGTLATLDGFRQGIRTNLLLALYYFRLVRACYGSFLETVTPLVGADERVLDESLVERETVELARSCRTSWDVVMAWDARAEQVRRQREEVNAAISFPLRSGELRDLVRDQALLRGVEPPSVNSVRKRLGAWYRAQFDERIGAVLPPVDDLPALIQRIHEVAREIAPDVHHQFDATISEILSAQPPAEFSDTSETGSTTDPIIRT